VIDLSRRVCVLITGGAGYIGSQSAKALAAAAFLPILVEDLRTGHRSAVQWGPLIETDLADKPALGRVFRTYPIAAVIHFAGSAYVGESMQFPQLYFQNNVGGTLSLLETMLEHGVTRIVFSSSCGADGHAKTIPITEEHPQQPVNPYGESKLMVEKILFWSAQADGLKYAILRYFNAANAALAEAHVAPMRYVESDGAAAVFNLDTGTGHSVRQVISAAKQVSGRKVPFQDLPRPPGDPGKLIADARKALRCLAWRPRYSDLQRIVQTAWAWRTSIRYRDRNAMVQSTSA
jgi:UDP-arabinose 4-epimerase